LITISALLIGGSQQVRSYLSQSRSAFHPIPVEATPEYKAAKWLHDQRPEGRVLVSGGLRFRLNSWFDVPQAGGAFESGLRNRTPVHFAYHIRTGGGSSPEKDVAESIQELKALGVEYVVIHGRSSAEHYRDYKNPQQFEGVLERVYGDTDDTIYRVPFNGIAHAIRPEEEPSRAFRDALTQYVKAIEDPGRPKLTTKWSHIDRLRIEGTVPEGMLISVQVSYDPGWRATSDGRSVAVEKDNLGFIKLRSTGPVDLEYSGTAEQKAFALLSAMTWIGAVGLLCKNRS
jgi:hypothetical protein